MLVVWVLQTFFLSTYYKEIKTRETTTAAKEIGALYQSGDRTEIRAKISQIYASNDMYIQIETEQGIPIFIPYIAIDDGSSSDDSSKSNDTEKNLESEIDDQLSTGSTQTQTQTDEEKAANITETDSNEPVVMPHLPPSVYQARISELKQALIDSGRNEISRTVTDSETKLMTLEYAAFLSSEGEDRNILYIFSPLYPMKGTVDILTSLLMYIIIISIILAFLVALYLSRRITHPLSVITESAKKLGDGEYGIVFEGGHYSEIIELADTLTYTSLELAKTDSMQKDVIANVSHDLRTPLTMVISYAEMIRDLSGEDPNKRSEHLQVIIDEADRLNQLVTDLLEISRMQSGDLELTQYEFSMKNTIESLLQSYAGFVEKEGFKLVFISKGEGMIRADEARIKQVIANLVSNAFKYSGRDKTIEVKMFDEEGYIRCEVSDHGIGIPKKDIRHIWERYYKASKHYHRAESTGLGLSIVKEILLLHGANFGVESALRNGSTFWFELKKLNLEEYDDNNFLDSYDPEASEI